MSGTPATKARRPTLKSVAGRAGVSLSTASLVFSGKGPVADATRERVLAAADELGYLGPDPLASSLRRGRAGVVAVIVEGRLLHAFHDPYAVSVLDGLAGVLDDMGTGMLLLSQSPAEPEHAIERLAGSAIDACVFLGCGSRTNPLVGHLSSRGIPMVAFGAPIDPGVLQVDVDDREATVALARHLADLGHTRVGHVALNGLPTPTAPEVVPLHELLVGDYPDVIARARGVADVFGAQAPAVVAPTSDVDGGHAAGLALLALPQRPTAILAQSDLLAVGVVRAAGDLGLRVPQDVSVTGFDGVPLDWWDATLTTAVQPGVDKGVVGGELLRALLRGERPQRITLPTRLRVGTTTGPTPTP